MMTLAMPYFANLAQRTINIPWTSNWFLPSLFAGVIIVSILAGLYPSFYLSRFKPVNVLKGRVSAGAKSPGLRSGLVIFQFTISFVLVASALIVQNQMAFIMTKDLGFDKNQVIQIHGVTSAMNATTFKDQLRQIPGVSNASNSSYIPVEGGHRNSSNVEPLPDGAQENFQSQFWRVDEDYIETMGMSLLQGRNFVAGRDTTRVPPAIINEALAKALGYQDPIGHKISERQPLEIIGVVKNFNFQSLEEQIQPLTLVFNNNSTITSVRVNTGNIPGLLTELERTWKKFSENAEFKYTFMDESYARTYENVRRMGVILNSFTGLAILIACLGLFGLSAYVIEQRKKELGVRKVLGASTVTVFNLLVKNFIGMVAISFIVAIPISIYLMNKWLESYAYRIDISWQIFVVTGAGALLITLLTISYQAVSAAWANPVSSLRSE
jgi:putative ABC transport system permease protein